MAIGSPPEASDRACRHAGALGLEQPLHDRDRMVEVMRIGLSSTTQPWTSRLSRRGWPWCRCLLPRPCCSLTGATPASPCASKNISSAPSESPIGGLMCCFGGHDHQLTLPNLANLVRGLFAPQMFASNFSIRSASSNLHRPEADIRCEFQVTRRATSPRKNFLLRSSAAITLSVSRPPSGMT